MRRKIINAYWYNCYNFLNLYGGLKKDHRSYVLRFESFLTIFSFINSANRSKLAAIKSDYFSPYKHNLFHLSPTLHLKNRKFERISQIDF